MVIIYVEEKTLIARLTNEKEPTMLFSKALAKCWIPADPIWFARRSTVAKI